MIRVRGFAVFSLSPNKLPTIQVTLQSSIAFYYKDSVLKKKGGKPITMLHFALFSNTVLIVFFSTTSSNQG